MDHTLPNLAFPIFRPFEPIFLILEVSQCLIHFLLRVQHKRTILHDFLIEWEAGNEDCASSQYTFFDKTA